MLDPMQLAADIDAARQGDPADFPAAFAAAYNSYAMAGVVGGAINTGGNAALLEAAIAAVESGPDTAANLGAALAAFWATVAIAPLPPNVAAVNNAAGMAAAFTAAIQSSITAVPVTPHYSGFAVALEAVVKSIVWTITPPAPAPAFTSGIV